MDDKYFIEEVIKNLKEIPSKTSVKKTESYTTNEIENVLWKTINELYAKRRKNERAKIRRFSR